MNSPYNGKFRVSQQFKGSAHDGLDLVGVDSKEIHSTVNGVVERAGWENPLNHKQGFGKYVRIKKDGTNDRYYFGHLSEVKVKVGDRVKITDVIGIEGSTGYSTGSHCHYCIRGNASKKEIKDVCVISGIPNALDTYNNEPVKTKEISVTYQTWDDIKNAWLPNVQDINDYAGIFGHDVCAVYANLSSGNIIYAVHTKGGKWLPEVINRNDYAGLFNKPIDGLMMKTDTDKTIHYAVHLRRSNRWLPYVTGYNANDKNNGYAGILGQEIDAIKIYLK